MRSAQNFARTCPGLKLKPHEVRLYALTLPDAEALARVLARNEREPGHLYVAENTYRVLRSQFEPLGEDEVAEVVPPALTTAAST